MTEVVRVDDLTIAVRRSNRRRTIEFTIGRDNSITLAAPEDAPLEQLERVAEKKLLALYIKLAERASFAHPPRRKEYVPGEGHFFLGRSYRLALTSGPEAPALRIEGDRFVLRRDCRSDADGVFVSWYTREGEQWLQRPVHRLADRVGVEVQTVRVQDLGYRWGSCGPRSGLNFHWRTLQLPPRIIEYVIAHELVHLIQPRHNEDYWRRVERAMPDYDSRKEWLAQNGRDF
jgi:predicted metal-dependent hydrolase